jgi:nitrite reductase/ring-hydroxylating ferredoxin subunit
MRSAYGRQTPPPDYELTCVEPRSPMGELLRRYWQPVCTSDELRDLPKKMKLLCEELVVFRDKKGRVGALEPHCSHRGTSLEWGRVEEAGLRRCYHGWLYDTQGQCIDMPCETEEFRKRMDVWHPAYPTLEYGGLVFVYMGPPGTEPLFPMYDVIDTRYRQDVVLRGMRLWGEYSVGFVKDCNWLQHYENIVDPWHLLMLHQMISGDQFEGALMQGAPRIGFESTSLGVRYRVVKDLPNGNRFVRHAECIVPNAFLKGSEELIEVVRAYIDSAGIVEDRKGWLFRTARGHNGSSLSDKPMSQPDAWRMIRRRAAAAGIAAEIGCHTFRATGITAYLANGGALEHAQEMAAHESRRTTKLYDRTKERLTQDEVERIRL